MILRHRVLLALILLGNAVAFAGVDPAAKLVTAVLAVVLVVDMARLPPIATEFRVTSLGVLAVAALQLIPLPGLLRRLLQPGFVDLVPVGWRPLSLAPWNTLEVAALLMVAFAVALGAARMASTRSGLPGLLWMIAVTGAVVALLGVIAEAGTPAHVLLVRLNTGGGNPYGPFVNSNHFAQAIELSLPAMVVLLAATVRHLDGTGESRQYVVATGIGALTMTALAIAALVRSGSRGGALFEAIALVVTLPLWRGPRQLGRRAWVMVGVVGIVAALGVGVASARFGDLRDAFSQLLTVEGLDGNTRWELWAGTVRSFTRAPVLGSGLGSYAFVIGIDKPATADAALANAHNDWLEWTSTSGVVGLGLLLVGVAALARRMMPGRVRGLRFDLRYPLAGAAMVLVATALHEMIGFGLTTPLNLYLAAAWIGLVWGIDNRTVRPSKAQATAAEPTATS